MKEREEAPARIGVNSRIYESPHTGIARYLEALYGLLIANGGNEYIFFQSSTNKALGHTKSLPSPLDLILKGALFDLLGAYFLIKKEHIAIFHAPSHVLPLIKPRGVKFVVTIHDLAFLAQPSNYSYLFRLYYRLAVHNSIKKADIILADSVSTKNDIMKYYRVEAEKIRVVYLGINRNNDRSFRKDSLPREGKYFFSVCTHPRRKNILSVLEAFAQSDALKNYSYLIAGVIPSDQLQELQVKIDSLGLGGRVKILGYVADRQLSELYQHAEFLIFPSFYEGFGLPVLEAIVNKCPVITSNNSSLVEIVPTDEWLIDPYNVEDISAKMMKMIKLKPHERDDLIRQNFEFSKKFTWENTARATEKVFTELSRARVSQMTARAKKGITGNA